MYTKVVKKHTISFTHAWRGIVHAATTQLNIRVHLAVATIVLALGVYLEISVREALILLLSISLVILAEMFNTAIEFVCDAITLKFSTPIGHAKDVAAGGVLISSVFAAIVGLIIFLPKIVIKL